MSAMTGTLHEGPAKWLRPTGLAAIIFGVATIFSGATALFGPAAAREALGAVVPFVLWFNFLSGFIYVAAGAGLMRRRRWGAVLSMLLAVAIGVVLAAFCWHVAAGGAYEMRTVGALLLRAGFWIVVALVARGSLGRWA